MCVCVFYTELANKEQEDQEGVESNINSDIQSRTLPSHSGDGSPPDETNDKKSPVHVPADHLTWNGIIA